MRTGYYGGVPVHVSRPEKIFWPAEGYTKGDLINFYQTVFPRLQPWVENRLLTLERCPDGIRGERFIQKMAPKGLPADTPTKPIHGTSKTTRYVVGGKLETQLALVNLGCIAVHVWASRADAPRQPDWLCFDIDPPDLQFRLAAKAALLVKQALDGLRLVSYPKTSGQKGMHVFVPLRVGPDADEVLEFAEKVCRRLAQSHPEALTVEAHIADRKGRVYLDAGRNGFAQTVATPYSVRAFPHAPVSTPLAWSDVTPSLDPINFNMGNFARQLARKNPWADFWKHRQTLPQL